MTAPRAAELASRDAPGARRPAGFPVPLHGARGYFTDYRCGASCGDAAVTWDYRGYRYTVGLKAGHRSEVIAAANSALGVGPVVPR